MSVRFQRLLMIFLSLTLLTFAIFLILINSKKNLIFFYTPTELLNSNLQINDTVRIGGFVKKDSVQKRGDNEYYFIITDKKSTLNVSYRGLLPDLFKEEQGVVIQGKITKKNYVDATTVFAKHDENYMPTPLKKQLQNSDYWKKEYK